MKRKPKEEETKMDLTRPINNLEIKDDDCFGQMWNPKDKNCALCSDLEICGIKYQEVIEDKKTNYEKEYEPLDMADFSCVNMSKIVDFIKKYQDDDPLTYEEVEEYVMDKAKIRDKTSVGEFLKRNFVKYNITIKDKKLYVQ